MLDRFNDEFSARSSEGSSEENEDNIIEDNGKKQSCDVIKIKSVYEAALIVKAAIQQQSSAMDCPWPPTAEDLTLSSAKGIIPFELYNLFAWIVGFSDDPRSTNYVEVDKNADLKLTSLCQDIIYLSFKGRILTPKSLALGMTIRHLTGSSRLLSIINKLGHSASVDTIIGLETSLAELHLNKQKLIPHAFARGVPTTLVWDNIDFGEETLSGKGTTHHTNGLMIQAHISDSTNQPNRRESLKKGIRCLKTLPCQIEDYHMQKKLGPLHIPPEACMLINQESYGKILKAAAVIEVAYHMTKVVASTIPGWTGFH